MARKHDLEEKAHFLAKRSYTEEISKDETTDGHSIYLTRHPELPEMYDSGHKQ